MAGHAEQHRLDEARRGTAPWKKWGPYLGTRGGDAARAADALIPEHVVGRPADFSPILVKAWESLRPLTLRDIHLKRLQEGRARRALLLAFDGSFPFSVGDRRLSVRSEPFSLLSFDFSRVPGIMEERATTWRALFFRSMQLEGAFPDDPTFRIVQLRHSDARWQDDLSDLPAACRNERVPLTSPRDVVQRIAEIPTRLHVPSECDRALLAAAAAKLVTQHRDAILEPLD